MRKALLWKPDGIARGSPEANNLGWRKGRPGWTEHQRERWKTVQLVCIGFQRDALVPVNSGHILHDCALLWKFGGIAEQETGAFSLWSRDEPLLPL